MKRARSAGTWIRYWPLFSAGVILLLLNALSPVLAPFVTAAVLAYILAPLVGALEARRWPRGGAVAVVMLAMIVILVTLVLVIVPLFATQLHALSNYFPQLLEWLKATALPWLSAHAHMDISLDPDRLKALVADHGDVAGQLLESVWQSVSARGKAFFGFASSLALLPVVLFYLLRDWHALLAQIDVLVPRRWHHAVRDLSGEVDMVLGQYLRGQLSVMLLMACFYSIGLWLTGLKSALPIGMVAGLLVFIPYLGVIVGVLLATLTAALQFQSLIGLLPIWGVFVAGQLVEGFYVTPRLVGERIGLHPLAVIFALLAFGQLFGFVGVLLALPLSAVTLVAVRRLRGRYLHSLWYRKQPRQP
ncbi:MAG: AI-2E family transporter [Burkholderiales bacterium]|nr:AI-2E family transporter [Burkholderiales bacterium]